MIDPSQKRLGIVQTVPPRVKIPSFATRSGATPSSLIFWGCSHELPVPNQMDNCAYTLFLFMLVSGSATLALTLKLRRSCTGSVPEVEGTPSAHFSTKPGGRSPAATITADLDWTVLYVR